MPNKYHNPAETLSNRRDDLLDDKVLGSMLQVIGMTVLLITFWINHLFPFQGSMTFATSLLLLVIAFFSYRTWKVMKRVKIMNIGIEAEKSVGHFLQQSISPLGYRVLNSLNMNNHDIDHVIVGPAGIFAIETKNLRWMKEKLVTFDGQVIQVNGRSLPKKDPIKQSKSCAREVSKFLESKNIDQYVVPIVLLPGRVIDSILTKGIVVANMKMFESYIQNSQKKLSAKQVKYFADLIAQ